MNQQGNKWLPSNHMPTTGVVRPQPSSSNYFNSSPQTSFNLNTSIYQMPNMQHQQLKTIQVKSREFMQMNGNSLIQQNLIASQKKLNQDATRQRHFNEQKEKFCSYNAKSTTPAPANANSHSFNGSSCQNVRSAVAASAGGKEPPSRQQLPLPRWLTEPAELPPVYKKAGDLVEAGDGFVDTSRAYMLLMRTTIQPALLGVMWEMVNRTQPGRLKVAEFHGLLALVALVQAGQPVPSADYLVSLHVPVYPAIDHPVLKSVSGPPVIVEKDVVATIETTGLNDLDEFNDFVSAPAAANADQSVTAVRRDALSLAANSGVPLHSAVPSRAPPPAIVSGVPPSATPGGVPPSAGHALPGLDQFASLSSASRGTVSGDTNDICFSSIGAPLDPINVPFVSDCESTVGRDSACGNKVTPLTLNPSDSSAQLHKYKIPPLPEPQSAGKSKGETINLPILGASPKHFVDEGFANFPANVTDKLDRKSCDKYAVLRGIAEEPDAATNSSSFDADFGDFHSAVTPCVATGIASVPATTIPTSGYPQQMDNVPTSTATFSTTFDDADIGRTYSMDPFGEFEDASKLDRPIFQINLKMTDDLKALVDEDDFGDFISSDSSYLNVADSLAETQSVASLELPDFEATMNLQNTFPAKVDAACPILSERIQTPINTTEESSTIQQECKTSSLEFEDISSINLSQSVPPPMVTEAIQVADKYSIMRDDLGQMEDSDRRNETWNKCLTGCHHLLSEGASILQRLPGEKDDILRDSLETSQMRDYLSNLNEVWRVCQRIMSSTRKVTTCSQIEDLLSENQNLWTTIVSISECQFDKMIDRDGQSGEHVMCNVCLCHGGATLSYGRHTYHTPCANLWLNAVDVILPTVDDSPGSIL